MPVVGLWAWRSLAADVSEQELLMPALNDVPVEVPLGTPVIADKGHDSDGNPAPQEPGETEPERWSEAAPLPASVVDRANERMAALLSRVGHAVGPLHVHVRGPSVFEL